MISLRSGELADVAIIPREQAIVFLSKPVRSRTALGLRLTTSRHRRGPGAAVDLINYGLTVGGAVRAVLRLGPAPFGNRPVIVVVGRDLASYGAYLMRLAGAGIASDDLVEFVKGCCARFRPDMLRRGRDVRYLVFLDEPKAWLIEGASVFELPGYTGEVYRRAGALFAGYSQWKSQSTRFVAPDGQVRSIYQSGKNILRDLPPETRLIASEPKQRAVFVLAQPGSLEYQAWRAALPTHVTKTWPKRKVQPRLLARLRRWLLDNTVWTVQGLATPAIGSFPLWSRFAPEWGKCGKIECRKTRRLTR